jgi:hypothetical protein
MPLKHLNCAVCVIAIVICCGCQNDDRAYVSGVIKGSDGKPIVGATVVARCAATGKSGSGATNEQGKYELGVEKTGDGIPPGEYTVIVIEDLGDWDHPKRPSFSSAYSDTSTSGLSFSVEAGQKLEFDAELNGPRAAETSDR